MFPKLTYPWFVKEALSVNRMFQNKELLFCNWWSAKWQHSALLLKSVPWSSWWSGRWYRWNLWRWRIWITLSQLIPEPHEICCVLACGFFTIAARTATLFASFVTDVLHSWIFGFQLPVSKNFWQMLSNVQADGWFQSGYVLLYRCCAVTAFLLHEP